MFELQVNKKTFIFNDNLTIDHKYGHQSIEKTSKSKWVYAKIKVSDLFI